MLSPRGKKELKINQRRILINSIEIGIPAPEQVFILGQRHTSNGKIIGRVRNSKTLNYKSFTPHRDGLFCERIFGPVQSYICACGKQGPLTTSKGTLKFCPRCEVEYTDQRARRYRVGYIGLVSPVTHIWHLKGRPSYLSLFLGKRKKTLARLAYCNDYLVEQAFSKVAVNAGLSLAKQHRGIVGVPSVAEQSSAVQNILSLTGSPTSFRRTEYCERSESSEATFFKNRILKGLKESAIPKGLVIKRLAKLRFAAVRDAVQSLSLKGLTIKRPREALAERSSAAQRDVVQSKGIKGFILSREQEKYKVWSSEAYFRDGPFDLAMRPRALRGPTLAERACLSELRSEKQAQTLPRLELRKVEEFDKQNRKCHTFLNSLRQLCTPEAGNRSSRSAISPSNNLEALNDKLSPRQPPKGGSCFARPLHRIGIESSRLLSFAEQPKVSAPEDRLELFRSAKIRPSKVRGQSSSSRKRSTLTLPPSSAQVKREVSLALRAARLGVYGSTERPNFSNFYKAKVSKVSIARQRDTLSYTRSHTLPFLPTFICEFHLRDGLLSFFDTFPPSQDIPIPVYCKIPRRYPLRDVHKFMANQAFSKVQFGASPVTLLPSGVYGTPEQQAEQTLTDSAVAELRSGAPFQLPELRCKAKLCNGSYVGPGFSEEPREALAERSSAGIPTKPLAAMQLRSGKGAADLCSANRNVVPVPSSVTTLREVLLSLLLGRVVTTLIGLSPSLASALNQPESLTSKSKVLVGAKPTVVMTRRIGSQLSILRSGWPHFREWPLQTSSAERSSAVPRKGVKLPLRSFGLLSEAEQPQRGLAKRSFAAKRLQSEALHRKIHKEIPKSGKIKRINALLHLKSFALAKSNRLISELPARFLARKGADEQFKVYETKPQTFYRDLSCVAAKGFVGMPAELRSASASRGPSGNPGPTKRVSEQKPRTKSSSSKSKIVYKDFNFKYASDSSLPVLGKSSTHLTIRLVFADGGSNIGRLSQAWLANPYRFSSGGLQSFALQREAKPDRLGVNKGTVGQDRVLSEAEQPSFFEKRKYVRTLAPETVTFVKQKFGAHKIIVEPGNPRLEQTSNQAVAELRSAAPIRTFLPMAQHRLVSSKGSVIQGYSSDSTTSVRLIKPYFVRLHSTTKGRLILRNYVSSESTSSARLILRSSASEDSFFSLRSWIRQRRTVPVLLGSGESVEDWLEYWFDQWLQNRDGVKRVLSFAEQAPLFGHYKYASQVAQTLLSKVKCYDRLEVRSKPQALKGLSLSSKREEQSTGFTPLWGQRILWSGNIFVGSRRLRTFASAALLQSFALQLRFSATGTRFRDRKFLLGSSVAELRSVAQFRMQSEALQALRVAAPEDRLPSKGVLSEWEAATQLHQNSASRNVVLGTPLEASPQKIEGQGFFKQSNSSISTIGQHFCTIKGPLLLLALREYTLGLTGRPVGNTAFFRHSQITIIVGTKTCTPKKGPNFPNVCALLLRKIAAPEFRLPPLGGKQSFALQANVSKAKMNKGHTLRSKVANSNEDKIRSVGPKHNIACYLSKHDALLSEAEQGCVPSLLRLQPYGLLPTDLPSVRRVYRNYVSLQSEALQAPTDRQPNGVQRVNWIKRGVFFPNRDDNRDSNCLDLNKQPVGSLLLRKSAQSFALQATDLGLLSPLALLNSSALDCGRGFCLEPLQGEALHAESTFQLPGLDRSSPSKSSAHELSLTFAAQKCAELRSANRNVVPAAELRSASKSSRFAKLSLRTSVHTQTGLTGTSLQSEALQRLQSYALQAKRDRPRSETPSVLTPLRGQPEPRSDNFGSQKLSLQASENKKEYKTIQTLDSKIWLPKIVTIFKIIGPTKAFGCNPTGCYRKWGKKRLQPIVAAQLNVGTRFRDAVFSQRLSKKRPKEPQKQSPNTKKLIFTGWRLQSEALQSKDSIIDLSILSEGNNKTAVTLLGQPELRLQSEALHGQSVEQAISVGNFREQSFAEQPKVRTLSVRTPGWLRGDHYKKNLAAKLRAPLLRKGEDSKPSLTNFRFVVAELSWARRALEKYKNNTDLEFSLTRKLSIPCRASLYSRNSGYRSERMGSTRNVLRTNSDSGQLSKAQLQGVGHNATDSATRAKFEFTGKGGTDSYMKAQLDLQAIQEVLSYTGGGALREVLRCFDTQAFSYILLNEIKLLREYHKGYFLYEYDQVSRQTRTRAKLELSLPPLVLSGTEHDHSNSSLAQVAPLKAEGDLAQTAPVAATQLPAELQSEALQRMVRPLATRRVASGLRSSKAKEIKTDNKLPFWSTETRLRQNEYKNNYDELPEEINRFSRAIHRNARRLKIVQLLMRNKRRPEWMLISALPVLPPDLRPILQMSENMIVASDLNTLYQRVIYRNNRQYKLRIVEWSYATSLQRLVQDAVDRLIENGKGGSKPFLTPSGRPLKSLSDTLKGKKGRFRLNLLGKRVDFSGRSVIVVSPYLKIHECGLPREMALELYQYLLIRQMLLKRQVSSVILAKRVIRQQKALVWDTLRELIYHHPLLLNRAPTLHRLGIQAFQPKLVLGSTILLHPLVCAGFNADFDGDQMGVHLPLCDEARAEAWDLLWSRNNLLSPATGEPILLPSQDMVLGFYHMTALLPSQHANSTTQTSVALRAAARAILRRAEKIGRHRSYGFVQIADCSAELSTSTQVRTSLLLDKGLQKSHFFSPLDVVRAYQNGGLDIHTPVWLQWKGKIENNDSHQAPLELRINSFGISTQLYPSYKYRKDVTSKSIATFNLFIRTTPGRVIVNNMVLAPRPE